MGDPSIEELERKMRPGAASKAGFLGPSESLAVVIKNDEATLISLGLVHRDLTDRLDEIISVAALVPFGNIIHDVSCGGRQPFGRQQTEVFDRFRVTLGGYGFQFCPWVSGGDHFTCQAGYLTVGGAYMSEMDWHITNLATSRELSGPGLVLHLARMHHFFEGLESPYRVDPRALAEVLDLV